MSIPRTLRDILVDGSRQYNDLPALSEVGGDGYTFREAHEHAVCAARLLRDRGIGAGARVALLSENRPEWGVWYLAVTSMGAVVVPILTDFSRDEVARIIEHAEPSVVVVSASMRKLLPEVDALDIATISATDDRLSSPGDPIAEAEVDEDILAAIIYTSGTTGAPKGVMLTHGNLVTNAYGARSLVTVGPADRFLSILPLAHTYECTIGFLAPYLAGASITYLDGPPALSKLLPALARVKPTMMLSVPLIMEKIYRSKVRPMFSKLGVLGRLTPVRKLVHRIAVAKVLETFGGSLRFFGVGGAALSPETERFLREGRFPYAIGYGLTETAPLLAGTNAENTRFRAAGPSIPQVEIRLAPLGGDAADEGTLSGSTTGPASKSRRRTRSGMHGRCRSVSEVGEVQARGPNVMLGYYRNPEATSAAFTADGWFKTGDLGSFDPDGYLTIRGRLKTMLVGPSGENVYPEEIEAAINAEALVEESLVLSAGGQLVARVRLNIEALAEHVGTISANLDAESLRKAGDDALSEVKAAVNARLNRFSKIAEMVLQTEEFERTPTRKIKRFLYQRRTKS